MGRGALIPSTSSQSTPSRQMTQLEAISTIGSVPAVVMRPARLHWALFFNIALCVASAMGAVALGYPYAGAVILVAFLAVCLGYRIAIRDEYGFLAIGVGVVPALLMLRGLFVYNSAIFIFVGGTLLFLSHSPEELKLVWRDRVIQAYGILALLYWWLTYLNTNEYANNLRLVELVLSATSVKLLSRRRSYLATAFLGLACSITCVALGMLPHSDIRLGIADIDGTRLGNPIILGIPCVLVLMLVLSDRGQWMFLEKHFLARAFIALVTGEWLVLSGSRGSWLAALGFVLILAILKPPDRKLLLVLGASMAFVTGLALTTPLGEKISQQYEKTLDSDRTLANRTSGRSAQWLAFPDAFSQSPIWGWGPGTGRNVVAIYTGRHLNWHALYLHVGAETGLIGLTALFSLLIAMGRRTYRHWRTFGEITPLLALLTYAFFGFSVSAFDADSGILIGLAFLGAEVAPRYMVYESTIRQVEYA